MSTEVLTAKSNKINPNRIIEFYLTDLIDNQKKDWKSNLSRIINKADDSSTSRDGDEVSNSHVKLFNLPEGSLDVNNDVDLVMINAPKSPKTNNNWSSPVSTFMESLTSSGSNLLGSISSLASFGINIISSWNDVFVNNGNTSGRTAQIFQPWTTGVQAWTGSAGGIDFEYEFKFNMGQYGLWNAEEEVVKPILNLVAPAFPQYMNNLGMSGPFPSTSELLLRLIKNISDDFITDHTIDWRNITFEKFSSGVTSYFSDTASSIVNYFKGSDSITGGILKGLNEVAGIFKTLVEESYKNLTYTLKFGNIITFENLLITQATTSFSNEVDQFGYPVSGTAKLTFKGLVPLALVNATDYGKTQMFPENTRYGGMN